MKSMRPVFTMLIALFLNCCLFNFSSAQTSLTSFVDPYIGSALHGHVFVGANTPYGAVQAGPTNITAGWDWCSGYNYIDTVVIGFSQTHLSGTGIGDLGDVTIMPVTGNVGVNPGKPGDETSGYYSLYDHKQESVKPGFYSVMLKRYNIRTEITASPRVGFYRFKYPASAQPGFIINLETGIGWDNPTDTYIRIINDSTISGYRFSKGWANDQKVFFTATFSKPFNKPQFYQKDSLLGNNTDAKGSRIKAYLQFPSLEKGGKLLVKVSISPVSEENALLDMNSEIPGWNFDQIKNAANAAWEKALGKVKADFITRDQKKVFYTALYHTMIAPSIFNDVNKDYRGADGKIYSNANFNNYTTFSLWDTYRAAQPLMTVLNPQMVPDIIQTFLHIYQQQGKLPVWHLMGNETNTMVGSPGVIVLGDAILKGFSPELAEQAYEAMVKSETNKHDSVLAEITKNGYLPGDKFNESVATAMEVAIADWTVAQVAKKLGKVKEYDYWIKRGLAFKEYFDPATRFMLAKMSDGSWRTPFDPFKSVHRKNDYTEGNGWQYLWLTPQDPEGLIKLLGGDKPFIAKLDSFFVAKGDMGPEASNDISGLIGQYAHGNEPSHHITYMYAYAGRPDKTAFRVREIMDSLYKSTPAGLCGNEDVGQMSAWYVFSAMGFYPANPANGKFVFGSPIITRAQIPLPNGKSFNMQVKNNSKENIYIQSAVLNGKAIMRSYITYKEVMAGGNLILTMGNRPSKTFGVAVKNRPTSSVE